MQPHIVVFGSINMDLVIRCDQLPRPGETILASHATESPGGKGANQAVAAARLGAKVSMIGCVGDDAFSQRLKNHLISEQVRCDEVRSIANCSSGLAVVAVESRGENSILVVPGANQHVTPQRISELSNAPGICDVVLIQLEIPLDAVAAAIRWSKSRRAKVILNPAPAPRELDAKLFEVDVLCPNRSEAEALLQVKIDSRESALMAVKELVRRGATQAVITLGADGAVACDGIQSRWIAPYQVQPVDTTAAGDAFAGGLAYRIGCGQTLWDALQFASACGALATTRPGAQAAMPTNEEVMILMGG